MQSAVVRAPLVVLVLLGVALEAVLLYLAWPLGVLTGIAGGALFTVVLGVRLQRDWDAPLRAERAERSEDLREPAESSTPPSSAAAA